MDNQDIIVCVADDLGLRVWLERSVDGAWPIDFVASSDLNRVIKMVEATRSCLVFVAVDDAEPDRTLRVISALVKSYPDLNVVTLAKRVTQDHLLKSMRAGARDCFLSDSDAEEMRAQIKVLLTREKTPAAGGGRTEDRARPLVNLITSVSSTVDTRFLTQSYAFAAAQRRPGQRILAIDTSATERHVFYLDSNNRLTLNDLLLSSDSLDESLVDTALEEYVPGLRMLAGNLPLANLTEERNADLFIAFAQLMQMFDYIVINVDPLLADYWVKVIGLQVSRLVMAIHPVVEQAHLAREKFQSWDSELSEKCARLLLVDGYEDKIPPGLSQLEAAVGVHSLGALPLDWSNRLLAMNAGIPIHSLPRRSAFNRKLDSMLKRADERLAGGKSQGKAANTLRRA